MSFSSASACSLRVRVFSMSRWFLSSSQVRAWFSAVFWLVGSSFPR